MSDILRTLALRPERVAVTFTPHLEGSAVLIRVELPDRYIDQAVSTLAVRDSLADVTSLTIEQALSELGITEAAPR